MNEISVIRKNINTRHDDGYYLEDFLIISYDGNTIWLPKGLGEEMVKLIWSQLSHDQLAGRQVD